MQIPNDEIIQRAKEIYLRLNGRDHREIEHEMHALGFTTFTRRVLYSRKYNNGTSNPGWIEKYGWREELGNEDTLVRISAKHERLAGQHSEEFAEVSRPAQAETRPSGSVPSERSKVQSPKSKESRQTRDSAAPPTADCPPPADFTAWLKRTSPRMTWDWKYQQLIYEKLQQVTDGSSKRLMIFLPPRHGKSELVTVRYSAWRLQQDPTLNIILGSYNQRLANRFSRKVRIALEDAQVRQEEETHVSEPGAVATGSLQCPTSATADSPHRNQEGGPTAPAPSDRQPPTADCRPAISRRRLNTVAEWETGLGGGFRAVGVGGGITGFGADLVIIDDPVRSRAEAESKTYRDKTYEWFCDDLYTRLEPNASIILIQTRWHEDDLAGRLLRDSEEEGSEQWDVISLPALAERNADTPVRMDDAAASEILLSTGGTVIEPPTRPAQPRMFSNRDEWRDYDHKLVDYERELAAAASSSPRLRVSAVKTSVDVLGRMDGEPLCPERFSTDDLLRIKRKLGTYSFSALYQQRPTPPEGGLFKRKWFSRIVDRAPDNLKWVRAYDLAISMRDTADYTASFRCALDRKTGELYISDGFRKRLEFPDQKHLIMQKMSKERDTEHGIEEALHGLAFIQELRREHRVFGCAFRGVRVKADKFTRALSWANLAEEGKVVLVRWSSTPGQTGSAWIDEFLDEVCTFPNSAHDDQVDAISLAVQMLERRKHGAWSF